MNTSTLTIEDRAWRILDAGEVTSTNDLARTEAPWTVVRARTQTAGRGRRERAWASSPGGLWMSMVLPAPARETGTAPLVAGLAVIRALRSLDVHGLRLRWPNDILAGPRKLGGLLAEHPAPDRLVIGLGLNLHNHPERDVPALAGLAVSLEDLGHGELDIPAVTAAILDQMTCCHEQWTTLGFSSLLGEFGPLWDGARPVEVLLPGETVRGTFLGIDPEGHPRLGMSSGAIRTLPGHHIEQLLEL